MLPDFPYICILGQVHCSYTLIFWWWSETLFGVLLWLECVFILIYRKKIKAIAHPAVGINVLVMVKYHVASYLEYLEQSISY